MTVLKKGDNYTREDVKRLLGLPLTRGGNWDTGYHEHEGVFYVFANVGAPGRTGHDYQNAWVGSQLHWFAKTHSKLADPQIQRLINPNSVVHLFCRSDNRAPFRYEGRATPAQMTNTTPVQVIWSLY